MKKLQTYSIARVSLQLSRLFWYFFLVIGSFVPITLLLAYLDKLPKTMNINMSIPVSTEMLQPAAEFGHSGISIDSAKANIEILTLAQEFPSMFLELSLFIMVGLTILLTILYQLKNLLNATVNEAVFTQQNIKRIKIIAILLFIIDPLRWIFFTFLSRPLFSEASANITITVSSPGYWFIGLLIYTIAAVFEKGYEMYQELKLTV
ncbi:DUF2975 domain-containing protein [Fodinibius sp. AD559]|uniref:DUF2975 domain-containing protein n=1 Tax=Fodinibius sp. AD559 TaxID=3424179 RepID=UPI004046AB58